MKNFFKKDVTATKFRRGFSLVEALVAISILSLSIAATFSAVQNGIQSSTLAKDQITAFYLTQEGMEFVRNIRDENALQNLGGTGANWLAGLSSGANDPCWYGNGGNNNSQKMCTVDSSAKQITTVSCPSNNLNSCPYIKQDLATGLFGYNSNWQDSHFKRWIVFQKMPNTDNEVVVTIYITWTESGGAQSFQVSESLLNHE